jgi:hypothetical protein
MKEICQSVVNLSINASPSSRLYRINSEQPKKDIIHDQTENHVPAFESSAEKTSDSLHTVYIGKSSNDRGINLHNLQNLRTFIGVRVKYGDDGDDGDDGVVVNFNRHISVVYPL